MKKRYLLVALMVFTFVLAEIASPESRHPFLQDLKQAYRSAGLSFTPEIEEYIFRKLPKPSDPLEQIGIGTELPTIRNSNEELLLYQSLEVLFSQFFKKIKAGESYCPVNKIKLNFGQSPEERIGISSGGYYRLFVAYWTLKAKFKEYHEKSFDLYGYANYYYLDAIIAKVENTLAGAFFPSTGPIQIPLSERRKGIEEMLEAFAPYMTISELYEGADPHVVGWPVLQ